MTVLAGSALRQAIKCPDNSMNLTTSKGICSSNDVLDTRLPLKRYLTYKQTLFKMFVAIKWDCMSTFRLEPYLCILQKMFITYCPASQE